MSLFSRCTAHYRQSSRRRYFQHAHIKPINSGCGKEGRIFNAWSMVTCQGSTRSELSMEMGRFMCDHTYLCVFFLCVFSSHPFWTSSSLDVPARVTQDF